MKDLKRPFHFSRIPVCLLFCKNIQWHLIACKRSRNTKIMRSGKSALMNICKMCVFDSKQALSRTWSCFHDNYSIWSRMKQTVNSQQRVGVTHSYSQLLWKSFIAQESVAWMFFRYGLSNLKSGRVRKFALQPGLKTQIGRILLTFDDSSEITHQLAPAIELKHWDDVLRLQKG